MKEYKKPTVEVVDIKVKDSVAAPTYTTDGDTITYWVMNNNS